MFRIALAAWLLVVACYHDAAPVAPPANKVAPDHGFADPLAFLPNDATVVFAIDLRQLRGSALWREYEPMIDAAVAPTFAKCGYDPLAALASISGAVRDSGDGVFVLRGLDRARTLQCLDRLDLSDTKVTDDHGVVTLVNKSGAVNMLTFANDTTLVIEGSHQPTRESLSNVLTSGAPLRGSARFLELYQRLEAGAGVSFLINGNSKIAAKFTSSGVHVNGVYGTVRFADTIELNIHTVTANAQQAAEIVSTLKPQVDQASAMLEKLDVTANGAVMTISAIATEPQVRSIVAMISAMLPK
jgi:hypothetical protein